MLIHYHQWYGEFHKYICRTPRLIGESLLHSVVGITDVAQKVWTLSLILNLIGRCNFEKVVSTEDT
jgi:hypothetical protein